MDSDDDSPPLFFPYGDSSSLDPQFPAYDQPTFAVRPYRIQPPSIPSSWERSYQPEFTTSGYQRYVAGELNVQAPSYSAFRQDGGNSINWNGDRRVTQAYYGGKPPSISAVVRNNNSATRFNGYKEAPPYFGVAPRRNPLVQRVKTAQAPNLSAVLRRNYSANGFHDDDGYGQAPSYSAVAPRNSSVPGVLVKKYYAARLNGYEQAPPSFSDVDPRNRSAPGVRTAIPAFIYPQEKEAASLVVSGSQQERRKATGLRKKKDYVADQKEKKEIEDRIVGNTIPTLKKDRSRRNRTSGYNSYDDGHDEAAAPTESKVDPRGSSDPGVSTTYDAEESPEFSKIGGDFSYDED
ncbi:hypothetical protein E3N88_24100 [Mikania micrantha]|uniref:Uncharacterized protein n=1 Tax=Mikania micrantha TaxID=192012 RepID=A0A5N6NG89_9ASTR|nr:hypothetical protein E3N88_24100 [Mikania micrantha]